MAIQANEATGGTAKAQSAQSDRSQSVDRAVEVLIALGRRGPMRLSEIISDLGLPDCSGLELIAEMRKHYSTPAIALSGYGMETDVLSSMAAGFNEHLTKPIDIELLLRTLDRLVAQA